MSVKHWNIIHYDELASTNEEMNLLLKSRELKDKSVVITEFQKAGRGQMGNFWEAEKGKNLLFSVLLEPYYLAPANQFQISQVISVAIISVLKKYSDYFSIKWPNDIYWKEQKIGGILIENSISGMVISHSIIGIGLNINQEKFPENLPNPVSLFQIKGNYIDMERLFDQLLCSVEGWCKKLKGGKSSYIKKHYMQYLFRRKGYWKYRNSEGVFNARILDIEPFGRLVLESEDGHENSYTFKEVEFIIEKPII